MVCVVSGMRGPLYSLWRSVPAIFIHGNMPNCHQEDQRKLPAKIHLDGLQGGSAEPRQAPVQVCFGGKSDLILLMAVWHVSMYEDGGNRPPQAI